MGLRIVCQPDAVQVAAELIRDRRLSSADLGIYVRFCFAAELFTEPDLELLVGEFQMPRAETEAALQRLIALDYLAEVPSSSNSDSGE